MKRLLLLAALWALAFALRLPGIGFLLPHLPEPDDHIVRQVELLALPREEALADRSYGKYPHLIAHLARLLPPIEPAEPSAELGEHLQRAAAPYMRVRWIVALLSALIAPATFLLAARFLPPRFAVLAAYLSATGLLGLCFSQQARPHAPAAALAVLGTHAALNLRRPFSLGAVLWAAFVLVLGAGCLHNGVALLLPLGVSLLLGAWADLRRGARGPLVTRAGVALFLLLCLAAALWLFAPFLFAGSGDTLAGELRLENGQLVQSGHVIGLQLFQGNGLFVLARTFWSYEPLVVVLVILAAVLSLVALAAHRGAGAICSNQTIADLLVVASYVLPYALVLAAYQRTYERLVLPLVPFASCLAAAALHGAMSRPGARARRTLVLALIALALVLQGALAAKLLLVRSRDDTAELAARWVQQNAEPTALIAFPHAINLPLACAEEELALNVRRGRDTSPTWFRYQSRTKIANAPSFRLAYLPIRGEKELRTISEDPQAYLRSVGADYYLLEDYSERKRDPVTTAIYQAMDSIADRVGRFSPYGEKASGARPLPFGYQDEPIGPVPAFGRQLLHAERTGPVIEIYAVRKAL